MTAFLKSMTVFDSRTRRSLLYLGAFITLLVFVSCNGDQSPVVTDPNSGGTIPNPGGNSGSGQSKDSTRVKKWATVYITAIGAIDSRETQARIDSVKTFYRDLVKEFNRGKVNRITLGFKMTGIIEKDNGESVIEYEVYSFMEEPCDPCTFPSTRPPYPDISGTDHQQER